MSTYEQQAQSVRDTDERGASSMGSGNGEALEEGGEESEEEEEEHDGEDEEEELPLDVGRFERAWWLLLRRVMADRRIPNLRRLSSRIWLSADQLAGIVYSLKV